MVSQRRVGTLGFILCILFQVLVIVPAEEVLSAPESCSVTSADGVCVWDDAVPEHTTQDLGSLNAKQEAASGDENDDFEVPEEQDYIVRFSDYKLQDVHRVELEASLSVQLKDAGEWTWIPRNNAATEYPTDFGLLRGPAASLPDLKAALANIGGVKDVHADQTLFRGLSWKEEDEAELFSEKMRQAKSKFRFARKQWQTVRKSDEADRKAHGPQTLDEHLKEQYDHIPPEGVEGAAFAQKRPGRITTKKTFDLEENNMSEEGGLLDLSHRGNSTTRKLLVSNSNQITEHCHAAGLWAKGFNGKGIKVALFDTGISLTHPHFKKIKGRTNWTNENTLNDGLGHGSFVAGVIASQSEECKGFADEAEIYTYRVFTNEQVSYTSWFLDAFNYAIVMKPDVLNLSIGGPDYLDFPFVQKVNEVTASGIIMVSAIGNDGPHFGTLNNPADQMDVIGVGGIDYGDRIAGFSSRGMTTHELPYGYGRVKPDIMAYGQQVFGSRNTGGCRALSGTSVASPVVAGAVTLLASTVPANKRKQILNPASMKQALVHGTSPIKQHGMSIMEQGNGKLDLMGAYSILKNYQPHASAIPAAWTLHRECSNNYWWPYCKQKMYADAQPLILNTTIVNGMGVVGWFKGPPEWVPGEHGDYLDVQYRYSERLWPWSGFLGLYLRIKSEASSFNGKVSGYVQFIIVSPPGEGELVNRESLVKVPIEVSVIPTPARERRILFDIYHNIRYPPTYIPRDNIDIKNDMLDWHADHPHTNYHDMFNNILTAGYYMEMLTSPFTCFDAKQYGALVMVDPEEEYHPDEVEKLAHDIKNEGLGLVLFAEWYNIDLMVSLKFFDDNTRSWWTPPVGGANVPGLNDLLRPYGIQLGDEHLMGTAKIGTMANIPFKSGANIANFPKGGTLLQGNFHTGRSSYSNRSPAHTSYPFMGWVQPKDHTGRIAIYGDSNCLDSSHATGSGGCTNLLDGMIKYVNSGVMQPAISGGAVPLVQPYTNGAQPPMRRQDVDMTGVFKTDKNVKPVCGVNDNVGTLNEVPASRGTQGDMVASSFTLADLPVVKEEVLHLDTSVRPSEGVSVEEHEVRQAEEEEEEMSQSEEAPSLTDPHEIAEAARKEHDPRIIGPLTVPNMKDHAPLNNVRASVADAIAHHAVERTHERERERAQVYSHEEAVPSHQEAVPEYAVPSYEQHELPQQIQVPKEINGVHATNRVDPVHPGEAGQDQDIDFVLHVSDSKMIYIFALFGGVLLGALYGNLCKKKRGKKKKTSALLSK